MVKVKIKIAKDIALKLSKNPFWNGYTNLYNYNKTYKHNELSNKVNGRKVKYWVQVYSADDSESDEFIPILEKD